MKRDSVPLAGAALLAVLAVTRLPPPRALFFAAATPFDRTRDPGAGPSFVLMTQAAQLIPPGASVAVRAASGREEQSSYCRLIAVGLLPGRRVLAAERQGEADFLVVAGAEAYQAPGARLLLQTPQGTLWERPR